MKNHNVVLSATILILSMYHSGISANENKNSENAGCHKLEVSCQVWPETIFWGDIIYFKCTRTNISNESVEITHARPRVAEMGYFFEGIRFRMDSDDMESYRYIPEHDSNGLKLIAPNFVKLYPSDSISFFTSLENPPLENLDDAFWRFARTKTAEEAFERTIVIIIPESFATPFVPLSFATTLEQNTSESFITITKKIVVQPRPENEMRLLEHWFELTPSPFVPPASRIPGSDGNLKWNSSEYYDFKKNGFRKSGENYVFVKGEKYNPCLFIRERNRKPAATCCPKTWEGWKELEESLVPSTMRDEIRLTRMMIQYCDTEDPAVLDELTEWFSDMNEIQRAVMTRSLYELPPELLSTSTAIHYPLKEFFESIQPFVHKDPPALW